MKKRIALVLALVVSLFWYTNSKADKHALVPAPQKVGDEQPEFGEPSQAVEDHLLQVRGEVAAAQAIEGSTDTLTIVASFVDEEGRPLEGVELVATFVAETSTAFADAKGTVKLELTGSQVRDSASRELKFAFKSPRTVSTLYTHKAPLAKDTQLGTFTLRAGGSVTGRVLDVDGQPVEGASVYCAGPVQERGSPDYEVRRILGSVPQSPVATTGADGRYMIQGVAASTYSVSAYFRGTLQSIGEPIALGPEQVAKQEDLVLQPVPDSAVIKGKVFEVDGSPMRDVNVESLSPSGQRSLASTRTNDLGEFSLPALPGSSQGIVGGREGLDALFAFDVKAGTLDLVLQDVKRNKIRVEARTASGESLDRFLVSTKTKSRRSTISGPQASIDGQGIELVAPNEEFFVNVRAANLMEFRAGPFLAAAPPKVVNALLEPYPLVAGQVLFKGAPVPGAEVEWFLATSRSHATRLAWGLHKLSQYSWGKTMTADDEGRFELDLSPVTQYGGGYEHLSLRAKSEGFACGPELAFQLAPGEDFGELVLQVSEPGVLEGRLITTSDEASPELFVSISRGDDRILTQQVDAAGKYRFEGLAPGLWQAVSLTKRMSMPEASRSYGILRAEEIPWSFEIHAGSTTQFDLDLDPVVPVWLECSGQFRVNGAAPVGWSWQIMRDGELHKAGAFDASGRFAFQGEVTGQVELWLRMESESDCGGAGHMQVLHLSAGKNQWSYDLPAASLLLTGLPLSRGEFSERTPLWHLSWEDPMRGFYWSSTVSCGPQEGLKLAQVPAGVVTLTKLPRRPPGIPTKQTVTLDPEEDRALEVE